MILVTGGNGRIGNVLVRKLLEKGYKLKLLLRETSDRKSLEGLDLDIVYGDVRDIESLKLAMKDIDVVFHLAGKINISKYQEEKTYDINVQGTKNLIEACISQGVKNLIYTSSIHAFSAPKDQSLITESNGFCIDSEERRGIYDCTKAYATKAIIKSKEKGLDTITLAPTGVVGPYDFEPSFFGKGMIFSIRNKFKYTVAGAYDYVDVRDVADAIIKAYELKKYGEIYLLGGERITMDEYFSYLKEIVGIKRKTLFLKNNIAIALGYIMSMFDKRSPITPYSVRTLESNSNVDHSKASRELGYAPRPVKESIKDQYEWLKSNGYIP